MKLDLSAGVDVDIALAFQGRVVFERERISMVKALIGRKLE